MDNQLAHDQLAHVHTTCTSNVPRFRGDGSTLANATHEPNGGTEQSHSEAHKNEVLRPKRKIIDCEPPEMTQHYTYISSGLARRIIHHTIALSHSSGLHRNDLLIVLKWITKLMTVLTCRQL